MFIGNKVRTQAERIMNDYGDITYDNTKSVKYYFGFEMENNISWFLFHVWA